MHLECLQGCLRTCLENIYLRRIPLFTVKYHYYKGSIVGPAYKIPFMGPFLQSVNPKFTEYKAKWDSGDLSCVSVFHK